VQGMETVVSVVLLLNGRAAVHQRRHHARRHATTTNAATRVRMLTRTPTLTHRCSFDGCRRTLPLQPCCCAAAWRWQPLRSDECVNS
jgi:hypothetical protein